MKHKIAVSINTLDDLTDLVNHNFLVTDKHVRRLFYKNNSITVLAITAIGLAIWSEAERRKQEEKLIQLSIQIQKLKYGKGE